MPSRTVFYVVGIAVTKPIAALSVFASLKVVKAYISTAVRMLIIPISLLLDYMFMQEIPNPIQVAGVVLVMLAFTPQPSLLSLHSSAFSPQPSLLSLLSSAFTPQPSLLSPLSSAFSPPPSLLSLLSSAFSPQPSLLSLHSSAFSPQPSLLSLLSSAFSPQPSLLSLLSSAPHFCVHFFFYYFRFATLVFHIDNLRDTGFRTHGIHFLVSTGTMVTFNFHTVPIQTVSWFPLNLGEAGISTEVRSMVGGPNVVIILSLCSHFTAEPKRVYTSRMYDIRSAIQELHKKYPETRVIVKTCNTRNHRHYRELVQMSDWISVLINQEMRSIMEDLNIAILDVWDMTVSQWHPHQSHPNQRVQDNEFDILMSHICPDMMLSKKLFSSVEVAAEGSVSLSGSRLTNRIVLALSCIEALVSFVILLFILRELVSMRDQQTSFMRDIRDQQMAFQTGLREELQAYLRDQENEAKSKAAVSHSLDVDSTEDWQRDESATFREYSEVHHRANRALMANRPSGPSGQVNICLVQLSA
ncbi:Neurexophilin [Branchiostoma belcheri]|nr:Neurexophilin [Branchiostoma belcheri]